MVPFIYPGQNQRLASTLLGHTHSASATTSSLGVLTAHTQTPRVTKSTMNANLLHVLQILTQLVIQVVRQQLGELSVLVVLLTIEEPIGDLVVLRVLHDGNDALQLDLVELTSALVQVHFGLAADEASIAATATLDGSKGEHDLLASVNVGVEETENVLEAGLLGDVYRLNGWMRNIRVKVPLSEGVSRVADTPV